MNMPPLGICVPVKYLRCRDGDTAEVELRTGQEVAVRLADVDAPEIRDSGGPEAKQWLETVLSEAEFIRLYIPLVDAGDDGTLDIIDILGAMSFDRVPGRLFVDGLDTTEHLRTFLGQR